MVAKKKCENSLTNLPFSVRYNKSANDDCFRLVGIEEKKQTPTAPINRNVSEFPFWFSSFPEVPKRSLFITTERGKREACKRHF